MGPLTVSDLEHFNERGFVYVRDGFSGDEAAAMRDVVWDALAPGGIRRDDPATWTVEAPSHLQHLKTHPAFDAVGSDRVVAAIDQLLGAGQWTRPEEWGAFFLLFPTGREWTAPHGTWHLDHDYTAPLEPLRALKVHSMFGDVAPRAGGMTIVAGSHIAVANYAAAHPPATGTPAAKIRKALMASDPYLVELGREGDREARIARFVDREEEVWGAPLRVVELTARAGDVILIHPLVLHTRPTNAGSAPRFLLNKDLYPRADRAAG